MLEIVRERVSRGAKVLDDMQPAWPHTINMDLLDMGNPQRCVLGQLNHPDGFTDRLVDVYEFVSSQSHWQPEGIMPNGREDDMAEFAFSHGFDAIMALGYYYPDLTEAWKVEIRNRRLAHV